MNRLETSPSDPTPSSRLRVGALLLGMTVALAVGPLLVSAPFAASLLYAQGIEAHDLGDGPVAIYNLVGSVRVEGTSGAEVRVEVQRRGPDADRLEVAVDRIDGRQALRVIFPDDRIVYTESEGSLRMRLNVADDGTFYGGDDGIGSWISRIVGGDHVRIRSSGRGLEAWADVRVLVPEGSEVATYLAAGSTRLEGVDAEARVKSGQGRIDVRDTRGALTLDTGSGAVTVTGSEGRLRVDTGSGSVAVTDAVGPRIEVDTGSGSVRLATVGGDVWVDTGSGSVELFEVEGGEVEVDTGSGSVDGEGITAESVEVDTGSGGVRLDRTSARTVAVDTGSGRVALDLIGDTESVLVDTGSGGVSLALGGRVGDVSVDTGSGSADITVTAAAGARVVVDAGGRIDVASTLPFTESRRTSGYLEGRLGDGSGRIHVDTGSGGVRLRGS